MALYVVIGTKAQLIKTAPVLREMETRGMEYVYIDTGQHLATTAEFRQLLGVRAPDFLLYPGDKDVTGLLEALRWSARILFQAFLQRNQIFKEQGLCLTHGDALTGLYGALIAKMGGCYVGHIEAGERTYNWRRPFPEEIVRRVVDRWSDLSFAMSDRSYQHLLEEKVGGRVVNVHENSLYDAARLALERPCELDLPESYVLASIHRFETILSKDRMGVIVATLEKIAQRIDVVFSLHRPTQEQLVKFDLLQRLEANGRIHLRSLFDYFSFIQAMHSCEFLITDGGGPQEESFYLGVPCLLMRRETERDFHPNVLVSEFDIEKVARFIEDYDKYRGTCAAPEISPSTLIVDAIEDWKHKAGPGSAAGERATAE